jgi:hypothetical protein
MNVSPSAAVHVSVGLVFGRDFFLYIFRANELLPLQNKSPKFRTAYEEKYIHKVKNAEFLGI